MNLRFVLSLVVLTLVLSVGAYAGSTCGDEPVEPAPTETVSEPDPAPEEPSGSQVILEGQSFVCNEAVDLDLLKVYDPRGNAIRLEPGCTGRIGRIEVDTWSADGVRVTPAINSRLPGVEAQDLVIGGGYVKCHAISGDTHQDGLQAGGGDRITFYNVSWDCLGNSNFFVSPYNGGTPTGIVCDGCYLAENSRSTVFLRNTDSSGVRNSTICQGRSPRLTFRVEDATNVINTGNTVMRCG